MYMPQQMQVQQQQVQHQLQLQAMDSMRHQMFTPSHFLMSNQQQQLSQLNVPLFTDQPISQPLSLHTPQPQPIGANTTTATAATTTTFSPISFYSSACAGFPLGYGVPSAIHAVNPSLYKMFTNYTVSPPSSTTSTPVTTTVAGTTATTAAMSFCDTSTSSTTSVSSNRGEVSCNKD